MKRLILIIILSISLSACSARHFSVDEKFVRSELDPKDVREVVDLYKPVAVLVLTFIATTEGYTIKKNFVTMGVPSQAVDLNREVLITARSGSGEVVARVSVFNPREIHTAGSDKPEIAVLDKAHFTISLPKPDLIKTIDVEVRRGPNASLKQSFKLKGLDR